MSRKYLFFDIDGTLLSGGYYGNTYIPDSTAEAIERLKAAGHFLCLATGRSEAMAREYMQQLKIDNMVSDGGYGITLAGKLLGIRPLPKERIVALIGECQSKGFAWGLQVDNSDTRLAPDGRFMEQTGDIYLKTRIVPGLDPQDYDTIYKAYIACLEPEEQRLQMLGSLPWIRFQSEYIYVEPAAKGSGIKKMLEMVGGSVEDTFVFGDSKNDLSMFGDPWTKVAMGNACGELKAKADYITTDVDKDGILNACRHFALL